jgi:hypothetical protein
MKLKFKLIPVLLIAVAVTYTACKKSSSSQTVDSKTVSSQVALGITQTLYSSFGGFSASEGLNAGTQMGINPGKIRLNLAKNRMGLNDVGDDLTCGLKVDTTISESVTFNNQQATVAGSINFGFICSNGTPTGINFGDNLTVTQSGGQVTGTYKLLQDFTIVALNVQDENSNISLDGTAAYSDDLKTSGKSTNESYNYTFKSIVIDPSGLIASGSATFSTKGSNAKGSWDYSGTVTFLGNQKVKITINGTAYNVDLQTGVVS